MGEPWVRVMVRVVVRVRAMLQLVLVVMAMSLCQNEHSVRIRDRGMEEEWVRIRDSAACRSGSVPNSIRATKSVSDPGTALDHDTCPNCTEIPKHMCN